MGLDAFNATLISGKDILRSTMAHLGMFPPDVNISSRGNNDLDSQNSLILKIFQDLLHLELWPISNLFGLLRTRTEAPLPSI